MDNIETALQLLGIGMITVFTILFLVVFLGNMIILFVNRYVPGTNVIAGTAPAVTTAGIEANKVAAIVASVKMVTGGKGNVIKIEKK
jgi:oxaloacetate decarboxylase gamma subunit